MRGSLVRIIRNYMKLLNIRPLNQSDLSCLWLVQTGHRSDKLIHHGVLLPRWLRASSPIIATAWDFLWSPRLMSRNPSMHPRACSQHTSKCIYILHYQHERTYQYPCELGSVCTCSSMSFLKVFIAWQLVSACPRCTSYKKGGGATHLRCSQ